MMCVADIISTARCQKVTCYIPSVGELPTSVLWPGARELICDVAAAFWPIYTIKLKKKSLFLFPCFKLLVASLAFLDRSA
jgi:hypothetical protein